MVSKSSPQALVLLFFCLGSKHMTDLAFAAKVTHNNEEQFCPPWGQD